MRIFATAILSALLLSTALSAAELDKRRKALDDLIAEQWEWQLRSAPEFASILGDRRYNDKSSDVSAAAMRRHDQQTRDFIRRFQAINPAGFSEQEALNRELMLRNLRDDDEEYRLKLWEMPVTQMSGIHL